jgi:hypothetical protein
MAAAKMETVRIGIQRQVAIIPLRCLLEEERMMFLTLLYNALPGIFVEIWNTIPVREEENVIPNIPREAQRIAHVPV